MAKVSSHRVRREDFEPLLAQGRSVHGPFLQFRWMAASGKKAATIVVSKKVAALAVDRNRLKRRGRAILKKLEKSLKPGFLGAFFCKAGSQKRTFAELEAEIEMLLKKAGLFS